MATASVTNTLVNATTITVGPLNTNFADLVTFLNTEVVHVDGSKAMSGNLDLDGNSLANVAWADIIPAADNTSDLGSAALSWRNVIAYGLQDESGTARIDLSARALEGGDWDINGAIVVDGGSVSAPSIRSDEDDNTGIYFPAAGNIQITVDAVAQFGVTSTQVQAPGVHDATTGSAANVHVLSTGSHQMLRSTSALKYKKNVKVAKELADIEILPTKHYRTDDKRDRYGLIADWLADQDPLLGVYNEAGEVESYDDRAVLAVLAAKILRLEEEIERLRSA